MFSPYRLLFRYCCSCLCWTCLSWSCACLCCSCSWRCCSINWRWSSCCCCRSSSRRCSINRSWCSSCCWTSWWFCRSRSSSCLCLPCSSMNWRNRRRLRRRCCRATLTTCKSPFSYTAATFMNCCCGGRLTISTFKWFCCTLTSTLGPIVAQVVASVLSKHKKFFKVPALRIQILKKLPLKRHSKFIESITFYLEQTQYIKVLLIILTSCLVAIQSLKIQLYWNS